MLQWLILLTLFFHNSLAYSLYDGIDDNRRWRRGVPSVETTEPRCKDQTAVCIKDILVLWDNSQSIGNTYFPDVKEFLKNLIRDKNMNVGEDGTHLGFITFSSKERTKKLLGVGDITDPEELIKKLDSYDYERDLMGDLTFTGTAFELASEVFKYPSPQNSRHDVPDVVLLFTDGLPNPHYHGSTKSKRIRVDQKIMADTYSTILKNNNVTIIGLAGGKPGTVAKFKPYVESWATTPEDVFESKLGELNKVVNKVVHASCKPGPCSGGCPCVNVSTEAYTSRGHKAPVEWLPPTYKCQNKDILSSLKTEITPNNLASGQKFPEGLHKITYKYYYPYGKMLKTAECHVSIEVIGCECPSVQTVFGTVDPGYIKASVEWSEPKPNCKITPNSANLNYTNKWFEVGEHTVKYEYTYRNNLHSFVLECPVNIVVTQGCECPSEQIVRKEVKLGHRKVSVNWNEPVPTCLTTPSPNNPQSTSESLPVGEYRRTYIYSHNFGQLKCHVNIFVEGQYCGGLAYNTATHVCCCGKAHLKKFIYRCCDTAYFNPNEKICCPNDSLVSLGGNCLEED